MPKEVTITLDKIRLTQVAPVFNDDQPRVAVMFDIISSSGEIYDHGRIVFWEEPPDLTGTEASTLPMPDAEYIKAPSGLIAKTKALWKALEKAVEKEVL